MLYYVIGVTSLLPPDQHTPAQKSSSDQHQLEVKNREIIHFF